ncbi:hypothetical protein ACMAZD_19385 [Vibrio sp. nBUS_14]
MHHEHLHHTLAAKAEHNALLSAATDVLLYLPIHIHHRLNLNQQIALL